MPHTPLATHHTEGVIEVGIDEAGRGPLFGRVYTAAVILPQDDTFPHYLMKDSKRFTSRTLLQETAEVIKAHAIEWAIDFAEADEIDKHNILNATYRSMHRAINALTLPPEHLLVDGDKFKPYLSKSALGQRETKFVPHTCVCKGDNTYTSIAAAGILAKVARDNWIDEICDREVELDERYGLRSNKGYGTKIHMDGLHQHGPHPQHRMSFAPCAAASNLA